MKPFARFLVVAVAFSLWACVPALALDDTPANRTAQADYYLGVVPPQALLNDMTDKISATLPGDQRPAFKALMGNYMADAMPPMMRELTKGKDLTQQQPGRIAAAGSAGAIAKNSTYRCCRTS